MKNVLVQYLQDEIACEVTRVNCLGDHEPGVILFAVNGTDDIRIELTVREATKLLDIIALATAEARLTLDCEVCK